MRTRTALTTLWAFGVALASSPAARADEPPPYTPDEVAPPVEAQPAPAAGEPGTGLEDPYYALPPPGGEAEEPPPVEEAPPLDDEAAWAAPTDGDADEAAWSDYYVDDGYDAEAYVDFQATLSPYGQWVSGTSYGNVWVPSSAVVGADFTPYGAGGHWVLTEYGWTWVSDWDWGWAPFHYGRWVTLGGYGWSWVPGRVWGPAWVSWRWGGGYVGWAPLGPRGMRIPPPPPGGQRSCWRFSTAAGFGDWRHPLLTAQAARSVFAATSPLRNVQVLNRYRVEAGPSPQMLANVARRPFVPASVRLFAAAAPRATIAPRVSPGISLAPRPPRPAITLGGRPYRGPAMSAPVFGCPAQPYRMPGPPPGLAVRPSPGYAAPPAMRGPAYSPPMYRSPAAPSPAYRGPSYAPPVYRAPTYSPPPTFRAPSAAAAPMYRAPSYAPAPSFRAPSYSPAPSFRAPSYSPAPSFRAPSYSPAPSFRPSFSAPPSRPSGSFSGGRFR